MTAVGLAVGGMALRRALPRARVLAIAVSASRDLLDAEIAQQAEDHAAGMRVLEMWETERYPYVLVLRNFALEAGSWRGKPSRGSLARRLAGAPGNVAPQEHFVSYSSMDAPQLGERLAEALEGRASVLTVTNAAAVHERRANLGQLVLPFDVWLPLVGRVAEGSSMVVIDLFAASPGVRAEQQALVAAGLASRTVIVSAGPERVEAANQMRGLTASLVGQAVEALVPVSLDDPMLASFTHKVVEKDIDFTDLDATPELAALLERIDQLRTMPPESRKKRLDADALFARSQDLIEAGDLHDALTTTKRMKRLYLEIGMDSRVVEAWLAVGLIHATLGDEQNAIDSWRSSLPVLERLDFDERVRVMSGYEPTLTLFYNLSDDDDKRRLLELLGTDESRSG